MKFSVIIPTYGRSEFLEQAIESILKQSYKEYEIIVVDDNGYKTENQCLTEVIIKKFAGIKYIINEINRGANFSRNQGIIQSEGDYICLLDDDDEFTFDKLETLKREIEKYNYDLLYSKVELIEISRNKKRNLFRKVKKKKLKEKILSFNFIGGNSCVTLRKKFIVENNILFDSNLLSCQDWYYWTEMIFAGAKIKSINKKLVKVKIHDGVRITNNLEKRITGHRDFFKKIEKYVVKFEKNQQQQIKKNQLKVIANIYYDMHKYQEYKEIIDTIKLLDIKDLLRIVLLKFNIRIDRFSIKKINNQKKIR